MSASVHRADRVIPTASGAAMIDFGMTPQTFRDQYFEKNCLLLRGALQSHSFDNRPFAWSDVDELLYRLEPLPPFFKLFKDGEVPATEYVDDVLELGAPRARIHKAKFYEFLRAGATVVMNRLESTSLVAQRLCQTVGRFAGHTTNSNAYLTFGGNGTFGKHWDTHDVFVIQLLGTKRWKVFKPTWPLPLSHQPSTGHEHTCPAQPVLECELTPGDVLYLPRGWWHQAIPTTGGSFHLSVGTYAPTAIEFIQWAMQRHLSHFEPARVGLHGGAQHIDVDGIVAQLSQVLRNPNELIEFHRSLSARERVNAEFDLQSLAEPPAAQGGGDWPDDTTVQLNTHYPIVFNGPHLVVNGMELRLESLRRVLVLHLDKSPALTLRALYAAAPMVPKAAVRAALQDLAQHDVVSIRRPG